MQTPKQTFITTLLEIDWDLMSTKQLHEKIRQAYYDYNMMAEPNEKYVLDDIIYYYMTEDEAMEWLNDQMINCNKIVEVHTLIDDAIINDGVFYVDAGGCLHSATEEDMHAFVDEAIEELSK